MSFPIVRHRRLRQNAGIRSMVRETVLHAEDLVQPIFVTYGSGVKSEISSMPGVYHFSLDTLKEEVDEIVNLGIPAVLLFGIPETKDSVGTSGFADDGIVQEATRLIKSWHPDLLVIADTCLCEFTDHGHCGMVHTFERDGHTCGDVLNDESLELLVRTAVSQAKAGADIIAPSNMMDGFVQAIRSDSMKPDFIMCRSCRIRLSMLRLLRSIPRSRRLRPAVRRPQNLSNGSG